MSSYQAVIFDLFGTLIQLTRHTRPYLRLCRSVNAANRLRESLVVDKPTLADFCEYLGVEKPPFLNELQADLDQDIAAAVGFCDTVATLQELRERGIRIAVVSNLASPYKQAFYRLGLNNLIDATIFSCDVGKSKPDPRIYDAALKALHAKPEESIMVGDSQVADVDGPMACGIRGYLLKRDGRHADAERLAKLSDMLEIVRN
ncbi:HAD-IA family hydrolase [bacterium]|nr:HAD-IA family hydrolase [bacterium]